MLVIIARLDFILKEKCLLTCLNLKMNNIFNELEIIIYNIIMHFHIDLKIEVLHNIFLLFSDFRMKSNHIYYFSHLTDKSLRKIIS